MEEEEEIRVLAYLSLKSNVCLFVSSSSLHVRSECETFCLRGDLKPRLVLPREPCSVRSALMKNSSSFSCDLVLDCSHSSNQNKSERKGSITFLQKQH